MFAGKPAFVFIQRVFFFSLVVQRELIVRGLLWFFIMTNLICFAISPFSCCDHTKKGNI